MTISVVIANYNGETVLGPTLEGLAGLAGMICHEVLVVDDGSTDQSCALVRQRFPHVQVCTLGVNRGPNTARNVGLHKATGEFVFFMDNDIILAPDCLQRMATVLNAHPGCAAVGCQIRLHQEPDRIQYDGVNIHYAGAAVQSVPGPPDMPRRVNALSAGALLVRREKALAAGGFDEDFIFGWEDGDFTFRLNSQGGDLLLAPGAVAYHIKHERKMKWVRQQLRNRWWFILKNYDARTLLLCGPAILVYQASLALFAIAKGRSGDVGAAYADVWRTRQDWMQKRRVLQEKKLRHDRDLLCGSGAILMGDFSSRWIRLGNRIMEWSLAAYWGLVRWALRK